MNIKEAKEQIKNAMIAYFTKDAAGDYVLPIEKQRPVFLMGPPGIGKTAVMEQIASEMGVGLLSYSMAHHTRQSALGLLFIGHRKFNGIEYDISEYTMSEIITSIYQLMEETGVKEGILFIDEINCVSETLAPVMLQFLQYKVFGRHRIPDGWIVVTAGNPPEYNNSVREFDIATWDRLKRIDIEPSFDAWKEYANKTGVHPSILSYLEIKKSDFYSIRSTVDGRTFVTARGWDDLSHMIRLYEMNGIKVDIRLIGQYLQDPGKAKDFSAYYDLFFKYKSDYQVDKILEGKASAEIKDRAENAKFDERLSLIRLMLDAVREEIRTVMDSWQVLKDLTETLVEYKAIIADPARKPSECMEELIEKKKKELSLGKKSESLSGDAKRQLKELIKILEDEKGLVSNIGKTEDAFGIIKNDFSDQIKKIKKFTKDAGNHLSNMFAFCESVFLGGQELLIIVTELTINPFTSDFISRFGCKEYFRHNKDLLIYDRQKEIESELAALKLN